MNFLAHYYTANPETKPYKLLGILLPDIVRNFSKIHNVKIENDFNSDIEEVNEMLEGIKLHIKGDNVFHNHKIFKSLELLAKQKLKEQNDITVKRKFIIAHVLVELLIDQYIINNYPDKLEMFYIRINEVDIDKANLFFETLKVSEKQSNFKRNFGHFREKRVLSQLKTNDGVILTLGIVFGTIFNYDFKANKELWFPIIDEMNKNINKMIPDLLSDLKMKLYE